ncbi:MAG: hypothetical protein M1816_000401 [Peltula sp. TS41687]|nr:MAG: hypothetical protein M1816_000401 [Peltula sp. TS41687]
MSHGGTADTAPFQPGMPLSSDKEGLPLELSSASKRNSYNDDVEPGVTLNAPVVEKSPDQSRKITGFKWVLVVLSLLSAIFLFSLDNTIVADLIPIIVNRFDNVKNLVWVSVGFTIGAVALSLPLGKLYATFDAKWLFIIWTVIFLAASALCGGAPNMDAMIIGRVLAGAGGNGMYLGTLTLLMITTTEKERSGYLALIGIIWGLGTVLGPVVGGAFGAASWRWAFFINPIIGFFCVAICIWCLPQSDPTPGAAYARRMRSFDYVGTVLIVAAITAIVMAISFGGTSYAWDSGQTIALFVLSGVLFVAFAVQQTLLLFTSETARLFPVHFLRNRNAVLLFVCAAACNAAGFVPIYYIPIYFQFTRGDSALESAVRLLPLILLLSAMVFANGQLMARFGSYQDWYIVGSILALVGGVLMSRIDVDTSKQSIYGYSVLVALGTGAYIQAGYTVIHLFIKPEDAAYGISFMGLAQLGGITLGLSIAGAVFVNRALIALASILPDVSRYQLQLAVSGTSSSFFSSLPSQTRDIALNALVHALRKVFVLPLSFLSHPQPESFAPSQGTVQN